MSNIATITSLATTQKTVGDNIYSVYYKADCSTFYWLAGEDYCYKEKVIQQANK